MLAFRSVAARRGAKRASGLGEPRRRLRPCGDGESAPKRRGKDPSCSAIHIRDKATIDHLTSGPSKPNMAPEGEKNRHQFTKSDGRTLDNAIHQEWTRLASEVLRNGC
jgi:hypothetical protein